LPPFLSWLTVCRRPLVRDAAVFFANARPAFEPDLLAVVRCFANREFELMQVVTHSITDLRPLGFSAACEDPM